MFLIALENSWFSTIVFNNDEATAIGISLSSFLPDIAAECRAARVAAAVSFADNICAISVRWPLAPTNPAAPDAAPETSAPEDGGPEDGGPDSGSGPEGGGGGNEERRGGFIRPRHHMPHYAYGGFTNDALLRYALHIAHQFGPDAAQRAVQIALQQAGRR